MNTNGNTIDTGYNGFPSEYEKNAVLKVLEELEVVDGNAEVDGGTNQGDNYVGEIRRVKAKGKTKSGQDFNLRLIYKSAPGVENRVHYIKILFDREIVAYEKVLPVIHRVQSSANPCDRLYTAKCYKTISEHLRETLILEDVSVYGFKMADRLKSLNWDQVSLVMKNLARLHGTSYVMKERHPEELQTLAVLCREIIMDETWFFEKSDGKTFHFNNIDMAIKSLKNPEHAEILEKLKLEIEKMMSEIMIPKEDNETAVICHGDAWTNNILFQYKDGVPTKLCFVDWQIVRYASPHLDIFYHITLCTDGKFKKEYWDKAFECYHDTLREYLKTFEIDVENVYPKEKFLNDRKKYAIFGLYWSIVLLPLILFKASDIALGADSNAVNEEYVRRINELVEHYVELGYIS